MRSRKSIILEAMVMALSDLFKVFTYILMMLYGVVVLFDGELNPDFPLQGESLLCGSVVCAVLMTLLKLWLIRR